jgi:hypothetical protein
MIQVVYIEEEKVDLSFEIWMRELGGVKTELQAQLHGGGGVNNAIVT